MAKSKKDNKAKSKPKKKRKSRGFAWDLFNFIGIPLILALMIKTSVVEAYVIPSGSMENTLLPGEHILGNKFIYGMRLPIPFLTDIKFPAIDEPKSGDIVVFRYPEDPRLNYIKRCIATEGQTVEIRDKKVYVDGELFPLPSDGKYDPKHMIPFTPKMRRQGGWRDNMPPTLVPEGKLFVMGDNRDHSFDSRFWGFVDRDQVLARAMNVLWSWQYPGQMNTESGNLSNVDIWMYTLKNLPYLITHIRWNRLFKVAS